jgi:uncharacterized protein YegP (UPF0339 family)
MRFLAHVATGIEPRNSHVRGAKKMKWPTYEIFLSEGTKKRPYSKSKRASNLDDLLNPKRFWYWHLEGANGEIQSVSEGYSTLQNARAGIAAHRKNALVARVVIRPANPVL